MAARDIIVIAGSAGAVEQIRALVGKLPRSFCGSLFIVVHTSAEGPGLLAHILGRAGVLPVVNPRQGEAIKPGHIYVAPPNHHLLLHRGHLELGNGPRENGFRPAADPMFRSAAKAYGPRVVGVVLSGGMDDGTLGLQMIKLRRGLAMVQDPDEALYRGMPDSAIQHVKIDYILSVEAMPKMLEELCSNGCAIKGAGMKNGKNNKHADMAMASDRGLPGAKLEGPPSGFICPECGGSLWEMKNGKLLHYQCHVGHAYTAGSLVAGQDGAVEEALWTALRTLEETAALRLRLADNARSRHMEQVAVGYEERAHEIEGRAGLIRKVLLEQNLPPKLKGYGSAKSAKFLSHQVEQSTKEKKSR